jgi:hypothetical protein
MTLYPARHQNGEEVQTGAPFSTPGAQAPGSLRWWVRRTGSRALRVPRAGPARTPLPTPLPDPAATQARRALSTSRWIIGVRISCIARSSLPPGMTIELARDMKLPWSIVTR